MLYTNEHTHKHAYTHTHIHTQIHARARRHTNARKHTHTHTYMPGTPKDYRKPFDAPPAPIQRSQICQSTLVTRPKRWRVQSRNDRGCQALPCFICLDAMLHLFGCDARRREVGGAWCTCARCVKHIRAARQLGPGLQQSGSVLPIKLTDAALQLIIFRPVFAARTS